MKGEITMPTFIKRDKKMFEKSAAIGSEPRKYIDLNEFEPGVEITASGPVIKIAEISRFEELSSITDVVYNGDILVIDYSLLASDELTLRRIIGELKNVAKDVNGDVAGIGKNLLFCTPSGMKIDRSKIKVGAKE
jgi:hypothetical protein